MQIWKELVANIKRNNSISLLFMVVIFVSIKRQHTENLIFSNSPPPRMCKSKSWSRGQCHMVYPSTKPDLRIRIHHCFEVDSFLNTEMKPYHTPWTCMIPNVKHMYENETASRTNRTYGLIKNGQSVICHS